ncbi:Do family serine endopeptidase [Amorphus orientalis]|uniref:Probable periplasmic serine endoprotease DegP-like n=1 Tax=Amorphus orientalis TaxID=649198 RepID=A0AAE3VN80_9HYPH|nr:Do family serine endopeptidase [Amorphus orientalis]MDQ0315136.1 serine protease Do [Amorphus orientalis]
MTMDHNTAENSHQFRRFAKRRKQIAVGTLALGVAGILAADMIVAPPTPARAENLSANITEQRAPGFADIVERVSPAVVSIRVKTEARPSLSGFQGMPEGSPFEHFFKQFEDQFGGGGGMPQDRRSNRGFSMGQGSGFIVSADGYVVTNNHVVDSANEVTVVMNDGETYDATVIGTDDKTDLALVKITGDHSFPFVTFTGGDVRVGDWVVAVGNPFGLGGSVTAGIVSARGREIGAGPYDDFIQIDAPINKGNSGGPTFNLAGEVVGVNTAIYSPSGGSVGIGFAIPAAIAVQVIEDLKDDGTVTRGWLGVQIQPITPDIADSLGLEELDGALVAQPQDDSPAAKAGIEAGDAILAVDGETVENPRDLARTIAGKSPGSTVALTVWRNGAEEEVQVELGTLSAGSQANASSDLAPGTDLSLGMRLAPAQDLGLEEQGVAVVEIDPESQAAEKGLKVGDVILNAGGVDVSSPADIQKSVEVAEGEGRKAVLLRVRSGEQIRFVALPVAKG